MNEYEIVAERIVTVYYTVLAESEEAAYGIWSNYTHDTASIWEDETDTDGESFGHITLMREDI